MNTKCTAVFIASLLATANVMAEPAFKKHLSFHQDKTTVKTPRETPRAVFSPAMSKYPFYRTITNGGNSKSVFADKPKAYRPDRKDRNV